MRKTFIVWIAAALLTASCAAQSNEELRKENEELRKEVNALKEGQKAILKDLDAIKNFLAGRREPEPFKGATLSLKGSPYMGNKDAPITMVEYSDYQCGFCARYFKNTLPQIVSDYVKAGKVKYVLRNFPLESIHPAALKAAAAALCAGEQGKYWEMHGRLFANPGTIGVEHLPEHGKAIQLDTTKFKACVDSEKYVAMIREEMAEAQKIGVQGTPTYFLGRTGKDGERLEATATLVGAQPFPVFKETLDKLLAAQ